MSTLHNLLKLIGQFGQNNNQFLSHTNQEGFECTANKNWLRAYCPNIYTVRLLLEATKRLMKHRGKISGQYATATKIKYSNRKSDENSTRTDFLNIWVKQNGSNYAKMVLQ